MPYTTSHHGRPVELLRRSSLPEWVSGQESTSGSILGAESHILGYPGVMYPISIARSLADNEARRTLTSKAKYFTQYVVRLLLLRNPGKGHSRISISMPRYHDAA